MQCHYVTREHSNCTHVSSLQVQINTTSGTCNKTIYLKNASISIPSNRDARCGFPSFGVNISVISQSYLRVVSTPSLSKSSLKVPWSLDISLDVILFCCIGHMMIRLIDQEVMTILYYLVRNGLITEWKWRPRANLLMEGPTDLVIWSMLKLSL